eukprot:GHVQ01029540.1.p1 GENE.GHVQ01029540.1~~GHVQ01029540.1.p1  ORF type:complete len:249 (+),score=31.34 GHVQ01029540.1:16-762(+)
MMGEERRDHEDGCGGVVAYVFGCGVVVVWGLQCAEHKEIVSDVLWFLKPFGEGFLRPDWIEEDVTFYCYVDEIHSANIPKSRIRHDTLYLKSRAEGEKLAASFAFSKSIRLCVVETAIELLTKGVEQIARDLALLGRQMYNTDAGHVITQFAELYCRIIELNIVEDFLDVPEYFWQDDRWEGFYLRLHKYLEIKARINLINHRYLCIKEMMTVITDDRSIVQEVRLTWIVILLLMLQVIFLVMEEFVR